MENLKPDRVPHEWVMHMETMFVIVTGERLGAAWTVFTCLVIEEGEDGVSFSRGQPGWESSVG